MRYRTGNYDYSHNATIWEGNKVLTLPPSLYRQKAPAWWPTGTPWPWVGPELNPMVQHLPAKDRSDAL